MFGFASFSELPFCALPDYGPGPVPPLPTYANYYIKLRTFTERWRF
jgi:hypothetical protein